MSVSWEIEKSYARVVHTCVYTCMFNYLLGQLGMGTIITRNKTKRNGLFLVTLKTLRFRFAY